jgi:hypothetical protein
VVYPVKGGLLLPDLKENSGNFYPNFGFEVLSLYYPTAKSVIVPLKAIL